MLSIDDWNDMTNLIEDLDWTGDRTSPASGQAVARAWKAISNNASTDRVSVKIKTYTEYTPLPTDDFTVSVPADKAREFVNNLVSDPVVGVVQIVAGVLPK